MKKIKKKPSTKENRKVRLIAVAAVASVVAVIMAVDYYMVFYRDNVSEAAGPDSLVKIYHDYSFDDLCKAVSESGAVANSRTFVRAARSMKLTGGFKPGSYQLRKGMNNKAIVRMLANGWQTPVKITFIGYIRTMDKFASILGTKLEADSASFAAALTDSALIASYGFEPESFIGMFIPDTYEVYWTVSPESLIARLNKEYKAFWNEERLSKAKKVGLTPKEVSTLASIVISETKYEPEMPRIAGVYINRLKRGMLLQADPTVIYACNQFGIKRVLNKHLKIDSPYNTYVHKGLPPGPITMSPVVAIDAVLNYERHNYIFFCARETFDGQHNFAATMSEHMANARRYHKALDARQK